MLSRFNQNSRYRFSFSKIEKEILAFKYIVRCQKLKFHFRWLASIYLSRYKKAYRSRLANHCFLTSRRRGYVRFAGLSRQQMRLLARNGDLPFIKKTSW